MNEDGDPQGKLFQNQNKSRNSPDQFLRKDFKHVITQNVFKTGVPKCEILPNGMVNADNQICFSMSKLNHRYIKHSFQSCRYNVDNT